MLLGGAGGENPKPEASEMLCFEFCTEVLASFLGRRAHVRVYVCLGSVTPRKQSGAARQAVNVLPTLLLCKWC